MRWTRELLERRRVRGTGSDYPGSSHRTQPALIRARVEKREDRGRRGLREAASGHHLSDIDGEKGTLSYVGYEIEDLAAHSSFEEVVHLLHHPSAPRPGSSMSPRGGTDLHPFQVQLMRPWPSRRRRCRWGARPSPRRRSTPTGGTSRRTQARKALRLIAKTASLLTTYHRLRTGMEISLNPALGHAADFLDAARRGARPRTSGCSIRRSCSTPTTR